MIGGVLVALNQCRTVDLKLFFKFFYKSVTFSIFFSLPDVDILGLSSSSLSLPSTSDKESAKLSTTKKNQKRSDFV